MSIHPKIAILFVVIMTVGNVPYDKATSETMPDIIYTQLDSYCIGKFQAMASQCEILVDTVDMVLTEKICRIAHQEAIRIEQKFSRYRDDNIIYAINHSSGNPVKLDKETCDLMDYAQYCYQLSDGLFDVTSGTLRKIWRFDGSDRIPAQQQVAAQLNFIGWDKVQWKRPFLSLREGMEIDLGGIGKEYAVDQATQQIMAQHNTSCLINFGGDIRTTGPRKGDTGWMIGIESTDSAFVQPVAVKSLCLKHGAIATSGNAKRFLLKDGIRYSHILNPKTGWPIINGPKSVTVAANTCTEAGILSTLALLHGSNAEEFLQIQNVKYWCEW